MARAFKKKKIVMADVYTWRKRLMQIKYSLSTSLLRFCLGRYDPWHDRNKNENCKPKLNDGRNER